MRLVQGSLCAIKAASRLRERERRERERVHVDVHGREVLWSMDATHLDRDGDGEAVQAELVKDVGTTTMAGAAVGAPACAGEVAALLETTAQERGGWPLVLATDNGPPYASREMAQVLERNKVVHLRSLPHTPQHNGWIEQAIGELKEVSAQDDPVNGEDPPRSGLAVGGEVSPGEAFGWPSSHEIPWGNSEEKASREELLQVWQARVERARRRIVQYRRRATRGYRTAETLDAIYPRGDHLVDRERFYEAVAMARSRAVAGLKEGRGRRRAQREAILNTMQRFRLITRTRGGVPIPAPKPESVS
ncbi:MAG TPA: transposase family protein [Planctomycetota bacterium]|nr:transposase family protein [Planctomycetota bacterium]